jgi:hypothetical protein
MHPDEMAQNLLVHGYASVHKLFLFYSLNERGGGISEAAMATFCMIGKECVIMGQNLARRWRV